METRSIGRTEIDETVEFLENAIKASHAEWGDKLVNWRAGQFGVVEEDLREWVVEYVKEQVLAEIVTQVKAMLFDDKEYESYEDAVLAAMYRLTAQGVVQGITLGLELHRRYCS